MRFHFVTLTAPFALLFALTAPAGAGPTPAPTATPVPLSIAMNAPVFPYGTQQGFTIGGNSHGNVCSASAQVTVPKGNTNLLILDVGVYGTLPYNSGNLLKLPSSNGQNYTIQIFANAGPNGCSGMATATFAVESQIGKLTGLTTSTSIVAANQPITFSVSGQSFSNPAN